MIYHSVSAFHLYAPKGVTRRGGSLCRSSGGLIGDPPGGERRSTVPHLLTNCRTPRPSGSPLAGRRCFVAARTSAEGTRAPRRSARFAGAAVRGSQGEAASAEPGRWNKHITELQSCRAAPPPSVRRSSEPQSLVKTDRP